MIALFSLSPEVRPYFLTGGNFKIILTQTVIVAIGALGMTMIIVSGGIDLSVGSVVALTSVVCATLLMNGVPRRRWSFLATMLAGGADRARQRLRSIGCLRMMPFIVTLGMMGVARGAAKWLAGNQTVNPATIAVNELDGALDQAPASFCRCPSASGWRSLLAALHGGVVLRQTGLRPLHLRDRLERSDRAAVRHSGAASESVDLRAGRLLLRLRRRDAVLPPDARRSRRWRSGWNSTSSPRW